MEHWSQPGPLNVGTGRDISIRDLALLIQDVVGYQGQMRFDASKPDGTPRKLLDVSRLEAAGWKASTSLRHGIEKTLAWYLEHQREPLVSPVQ